MGFLIGSSCFVHSPLHQSLFSNPSSHSFFSFSSPRNGQRKHTTSIACTHQQDTTDIDFCRRKAIIFMGFTLLPLLNINAQAAQAFVAEDSKQSSEEQKQKAQQENASSNSILSLLNGLGVVSAGVLGALYALAQKEKAASDATIESMTSKLKGKDSEILSMQKNFETELLNEKEVRNKEVKKANEEKQSLVGELTSAIGTITDLGKELQKEKRLAEELKFEVESLENSLEKAREEKTQLQEKLNEKLDSIEVLQGRINLLSSEVKNKEDNLRSLGLVLSEKETEFSNLCSIYQQSRDQVKGLESEITELKNVLAEYKTELHVKSSSVYDLNTQVTSLLTERDEINEKLDEILKQYNELKSDSEAKAASDAKLLEEREQKLNRLQEQLRFAHDEDRKSKLMVVDLTHERDDIRKMLDIELKNVKNLERELKTTQVSFEKSKLEASDLEKHLQQSRNLYSKLEAELTKVRAEFSKARESLQTEINNAKHDSDVLLGEVASSKNLLKKTNEELQTTFQELASVTKNRDNLQKEVFDAVEKAETATRYLEEEKKNVTSLSKELKLFETQILKDKETRRSLEANLDETTKSLEEMNKNALTFAREIELASSRISNLEEEKEIVYKSLTEQKHISHEARENLEDAHNLVMRLGKERENLEKRGLKLEEELASAKGEILRLRSQLNSSKAPINDHPQEKVEVAEKVVVPEKRTRRRKAAPPQNDSSC